MPSNKRQLVEKKHLPAELAQRVRELMARGSRVLGLRLCFHDHWGRSELPVEWRTHRLPYCLARKAEDEKRCASFDGIEVHQALAGRPEGRIHVCPCGMTELAAPVLCEGLFAGVLFAGGFWNGPGESPAPELPPAPSREWLEDRLPVLKALATELGDLLRGEKVHLPPDRRRQILNFLAETAERPTALTDLAGELGLSVSRAGHLVKELFGCTFPRLQAQFKLREAAHYLVSTELPVGEVASLVGYEDQNYFSRLFQREYRQAPREYRRQNRQAP